MAGPRPAAGLLLLTGGRGRRFGGPKHLQPHPAGGTWGGHLVRVFETVFPGCPLQVLGEALPDRPDLPPLQDPRQGPAAALRHWAGTPRPGPQRWWVAACDQVRWNPEALAEWHAAVQAADPGAGRWVLARYQGRIQPLGGFLAEVLVDRLPAIPGASLLALVDALPCVVLDSESNVWADLDTGEDREAYLKGIS
jgi:molybdopterin-guanine dinucleotide biosynthesis protein A